MGAIRSPDKVKLITGLISSDEGLLLGIKRPLERVLGNTVDFESRVIPFDWTDYYKEEMGSPLKRIFYGFRDLVKPEDAYKAKIRSNLLERRFSRSGKRTVNIDPGYVDMAKLVLFSTKDYSHRTCAGKGIFAEVTLHYKNGSFTFWPWTYPDYRSACYLDILHRIRELYKEQIRVS